MSEKVDITYSINSNSLTPEQLDVFKEALFKSKGQSNNQLGGLLAVAGATSTEIAKLASRVHSTHPFWRRVSGALKPAPRAVMQVVKEVPNFWDTIKGKNLKERYAGVLEKMNINPEIELPVTRLDADLSREYIQRTFKVTGETYCMYQEQRNLQYDSAMRDKLGMVDVFSPLAEVKFLNDNALERLIESTAHEQEFKIPDYDKYRKYEIDSLAKLKPEVAEKIRANKLLCDVLQSECSWVFRQNANSQQSIELMCIMEGFYDVCREMGIVGIVDGSVNGRSWMTTAASKGVMQNVIKLSGTYRRLVKSGFAESVARETVLAEINENISKRASHPQVRFYARDDYKDTPEEERELAKKASKSGTGTPRNRVLTLDEFMKATGLKKED